MFCLNRFTLVSLACLLWVGFLCFAQNAEQTFTNQRLEMANQVFSQSVEVNESVRFALEDVPRHLFLPGEFREYAYLPHTVPLKQGGFAPDPFNLASALLALSPQPGERILVVADPTGYFSAMISVSGASVDLLEPDRSKRNRLTQLYISLEYTNIALLDAQTLADISDDITYNKIIFLTAVNEVTEQTFQRLDRQGGQVIVALRTTEGNQMLVKYVKTETGTSLSVIGNVFFPGL